MAKYLGLQRIKNIKSRLSKDLSTVLLSELENLNATGLKQCLKTYELIEGWEEAEEVVRKVFREYCRNVSLYVQLLWTCYCETKYTL